MPGASLRLRALLDLSGVSRCHLRQREARGMSAVTINGDLRSGRLKGALAWAEKGVRVFPSHSTDKQGHCTCDNRQCDHPGKHPRIKDWPNQATTDAKQIERWWRRWPGANIVGITGEAFDVLDIEPQYVGAFNKLGIDLSAYPCHETPRGGLHFFVTADDLSGQLSGIGEIKGLGGCVHLPPSKIGEGSYRELAEVNGDLLPLPKALRDRLVPWDRADKRGPKPSVPMKVKLTKVNRTGRTEKASSRKARGFHRTDTGNAERLIARHGEKLRWVEELGWLHWDGQRWKTDEAQAHRLAIETARSIYDEIAEAKTDGGRAEIAKWAMRSEAAEKRRAMLDTGRWMEPINVKVAELD